MIESIREEIEYRLEILGEDCVYYVHRLRKPLMFGAFLSLILTFKHGSEVTALMKSKLSGISSLGSLRNTPKSSMFPFSSGYAQTSTQATAALTDAYPNLKAVKGGTFLDYGSTKKFAGEIATLRSVEAAQPVEDMLASPGMGKVLVVDGGASTRAAIFDAAMARKASLNGWAGVIINGCVRNKEALESISIGVKALCTHPERGRGKGSKSGGKLAISGVVFAEGKYVYADEDGIVMSKTKQEYVSDVSSSFGSSGFSQGGYDMSSSSYGGASTYGAGGSTYGTGAGSSGVGASSYGTTGASSFGTGAGSYGTGAGSYGTGSQSYGTGAGSYSTGTSSLGGGGGFGGGSSTVGYGGGTQGTFGSGGTGAGAGAVAGGGVGVGGGGAGYGTGPSTSGFGGGSQGYGAGTGGYGSGNFRKTRRLP